MKKLFLLIVCLLGSAAIAAQNEKKEGDEMADAENYSGAATMYRLCMEQDEECLLKLIRLVYDEKITPQTSGELYQLTEPLAQKENAEAQFYLGTMYMKGFAVTQNNGEAFKWITKSAEQDYTDAQNELGRMYQTGTGIRQNNREALKWYQKSAEQGHPEAQYQLGLIYQKGLGVRQNEDEAIKWFQLSAAQGHELAKISADEITQKFQKQAAEAQAKRDKAEAEAKAKQEKAESEAQAKRDRVEAEAKAKQEKAVAEAQVKRPTPATAEKKPDNLNIQKATSNRSNLLFIAGGACVVAGVVATVASAKPYTEYGNAKRIEGKEYNFLYAGVGIVGGGVCIGSGIRIKKKQNLQPGKISSDYTPSPLPAGRDNYSILNLVAAGNAVGLRLTF